MSKTAAVAGPCKVSGSTAEKIIGKKRINNLGASHNFKYGTQARLKEVYITSCRLEPHTTLHEVPDRSNLTTSVTIYPPTTNEQ